MMAGPIAGAFTMADSVAFATLSSGITSLGTAMILGGVSQMLSSPPKPTSVASNQSNLLFSGAVNTTAQGAAVPICYGRMRIGSQVISAGIESVQLPHVVGASSAPGFAAMGSGGK
jgi:predicted phage tail protein